MHDTRDKIEDMIYVLIILLCTVSVGSAVGNVNQNIPQGFQRLGDFEIFNGTGILPGYILQHALMPNGFFAPLEKNRNIAKIIEANMRNQTYIPENSMRNVSNMSKGILASSKNAVGGSSKAVSSSSGITFTGNASDLWKESTDGSISGQIVGDLDGDGTNDTLITTSKYDINTGNYSYMLKAQKGKDGSTLWEESVSGKNLWLYGFATRDLNGDGLSDVFIQISSYDSVTQTYDYIFKVRKGSDGTELWRSHYNINGYVNVNIVPDVSGDHLDDMLVDIYSNTANYRTLEMRKGIDNVLLWQKSIDQYGNIVTNGVGDLSGDGLNDLLITHGNTNILEALRGNSGSVIWQWSPINYGYAQSGPYIGDIVDLNGDGIKDVLVYVYSQSYGIRSDVYAIRGNNGVTLWQKSVVGSGSIDETSLGDVDKNGINDVLIHMLNDTTGYQSFGPVRGSDGNEMWSWGGYPNSYYISSYATDLNNDNANDLLVRIQYYISGIYYVNLYAIKGNNGNYMWDESQSGNNAYLYGNPIGDINGDGFNDVLITRYDYNTNMYALKVVRGIDDTELWSKSCADCSIGDVGDINGDGISELLLTGSNALSMIRGTDGTELWKKSYSGSYPYGHIVGDMDGDKLKDVLVSISADNTGYNAIQAIKGTNGANIWSAEAYSWIWNGDSTNEDDLNGDGIHDILLGLYNEVHAVTFDTSRVEFSIGNYSVKYGKNITVPLTMATNGKVGSLQLNISFDKRAVKADGISPGDAIGSNLFVSKIDNNGGNISISAVSTTGLTGGNIANITFNTTGGTVPYTDLIPKIIDVTDINNNHFTAIKKYSGNITIYNRLKGDVNDDGIITTADALLYLRYSVGQDISPYHMDNNDDVTCDGVITAADALKVLRKAVGQNVNLIC